MRDILDIHSDIFEKKPHSILGGLTGKQSKIRDLIGANKLFDPDDVPPPLVQMLPDGVSIPDASDTDQQKLARESIPDPKGQMHLPLFPSSHQTAAEQTSIFDHYCKYAFMRSQLSRIVPN